MIIFYYGGDYDIRSLTIPSISNLNMGAVSEKYFGVLYLKEYYRNTQANRRDSIARAKILDNRQPAMEDKSDVRIRTMHFLFEERIAGLIVPVPI